MNINKLNKFKSIQKVISKQKKVQCKKMNKKIIKQINIKINKSLHAEYIVKGHKKEKDVILRQE